MRRRFIQDPKTHKMIEVKARTPGKPFDPADFTPRDKEREAMYSGGPFDRERRLKAIRFACEAAGRPDPERRQMIDNFRALEK